MLLYYHKFFVNARLFPKLFLNFFSKKNSNFSREKSPTNNLKQASSSPNKRKHRTKHQERQPTPTRATSPTTKHQQAPATLRKHYSKKTLSKYGNNSKNFNHIQTRVPFNEPTLQYQYFEQIL